MNNIVSDWDNMAEAYEIFNNSEDSYSYNIEWPCIRRMLPEIQGKDILDLGCGTGIFSFLFEQYDPARIVGIDASREMLKIATQKAKQKNSKADFILGDAANAAAYVQKQFDLVFSSTTTHYIPDLEALFRSIGKCLKSNGVCILSVIHPVYSAMYPIRHGERFPNDDEWVVRYLDKRQRAYIQPWIEYNDRFENRLSTSYHYTFGDYVNAIVKSGLVIKEVEEPLPPEDWKQTSPERYDSFVETPTYMIMKLGKNPNATD
ncbi:MAG: class I SAM-dependent methyltransferase [Eubacteriales bacterium]